MNLRILTSEEELVFDQVIEQRLQSKQNSDFFIYEVNKVQKQLNATGKSIDCGVGIPEQHNIIWKLGEDGFFNVDCIEGFIWNDHCNRYITILAHNDDEWLHREYGKSCEPFLNVEHKDDVYFIELGVNRIKFINDNCRANISCALLYDSDNLCFIIKCDNGEEYTISNNHLKPDLRPYEVLKIAAKKPGKEYKRSYLDRHLSAENKIDGESISSQVFSNNCIVRNELQPLVELMVDTIEVKPSTKITSAQLDAIKKICN